MIATPQGLAGEFRLSSVSTDLSFLAQSQPRLKIGSTAQSGYDCFLSHVRKTNDGRWVMKLQGVESREGLTGLLGLNLWQWQDEAQVSAVGQKVFTTDGTPWGVIEAVENYGAGDIFVIFVASCEKRVDIPAVMGEFLEERPDGYNLLASPEDFAELWY